MSEARQRADWLVVAAMVLAVLLMPLVLYVGSYVATSRMDDSFSHWRVRHFSSHYQAELYSPAMKVESWICGRHVLPNYPLTGIPGGYTDAPLIAPILDDVMPD